MNKHVKQALVKELSSRELYWNNELENVESIATSKIDYIMENMCWEEMSAEQVIDFAINELHVCSCGNADTEDNMKIMSDYEKYCLECRF